MIIKNFLDPNNKEEFNDVETFLDLKLAISAKIGVEANLINLIYMDDIIRNENELIIHRDFQKYECIKYLVTDLNRNNSVIKIKHYCNKKSSFFQIQWSETVSEICENFIKTRHFGEGYAAYLYNEKKHFMDPGKTILENGEMENIEYYPVVVYSFTNMNLTQYYVEITPYPDDQIPDIISRLKYHTDCNDDGIEMITYYNHHRLDKDTSLTEFGVDLKIPLLFNITIFNVKLKVYFNDKNGLLSIYPIRSITRCEELIEFINKKFGIRSNLKIFKKSNVFDLKASMKDIGIRECEVAIGVNTQNIGQGKDIDRSFKYLTGNLREIIAKNYRASFVPQILELSRIEKMSLVVVDLKDARTMVEFGEDDLTDYLHRIAETICKSKRVKLFFNNEQLEMNKTIGSCGIKEGDILQCREVRILKVAVECGSKYNIDISIETSCTLSDLITMACLEPLVPASQVICLINNQHEDNSRKIKEITNMKVVKIINKQKQVALKLPNGYLVPFQLSLLDTCNYLYNQVILIANELQHRLSINSFCLYYRFRHITKTEEPLLKYDIEDGDEIETQLITIKLTLELPKPIEITMNLYDTCTDLYEIALAHQMSLMEIDDPINIDNLFIYHNSRHIIRSDLTLLDREICDGDEIQVLTKTIGNISQSQRQPVNRTCKIFYKTFPATNFDRITYDAAGTGADLESTIQYQYQCHSDLDIYDLSGAWIDPSKTLPVVWDFIFTKINSKKLNLTLPNGTSDVVLVDDRDSISSLKYILKQQFDVFEEGILNMRLFFQSHQLEDDKTIGYYGLRENDTIEIKPCTAQIRVKSENFEFYPVEIFGNESGGDLIQKIKNLTGINENINLKFQNKEFSKHHLLSDLNNDDIIVFTILKDPRIFKLNDLSTGVKPILQSLPENEEFKLDNLKPALLSKDETRNVVFFKDDSPLLSNVARGSDKFTELEFIKTENIDTENGRILYNLGQGSFGAVQLYQDKEDPDTLYAMKRFLFDNDHKTVYLSLKRELQYTQVIGDNDYLVKAYNCSSDGKNIYIKMEYLSGGSLRGYIEKQPNKRLKDSEISKFSRDILQGLKYLHDRNILHRDIKCANVVLDDQNKAKLCDFGLVKLNLDCDRESFLEGFKQTHCGSLCYMAPEVMENEKYGPKADIYSFGITVIEMITGKPPFVECQEEDMLRIKKTCKQIPIKVKKITCNLRKFYEICTLPNPDKRPTVDDLLEHDFLCDRN